MIGPGNAGTLVYNLQQKLGQVLNIKLHPSGMYDEATARAVKLYQTKKYVTGLATEETLADLDKDYEIYNQWQKAINSDSGSRGFSIEDLKGFILQDINKIIMEDWIMFESDITDNCSVGRNSCPVDSIFLYYTQTAGIEDAVAIMKSTTNARRSSVHFIIDYDGKIIKMVDLANASWHSGMFFRADDQSVSIALQNWGPLVKKGNNLFLKDSEVVYDKEVFGPPLPDPENPLAFWMPITREQMVSVSMIIKTLIAHIPDIIKGSGIKRITVASEHPGIDEAGLNTKYGLSKET